jgi:hypothetical protein
MDKSSAHVHRAVTSSLVRLNCRQRKETAMDCGVGSVDVLFVEMCDLQAAVQCSFSMTLWTWLFTVYAEAGLSAMSHVSSAIRTMISRSAWSFAPLGQSLPGSATTT